MVFKGEWFLMVVSMCVCVCVCVCAFENEWFLSGFIQALKYLLMYDLRLYIKKQFKTI